MSTLRTDTLQTTDSSFSIDVSDLVTGRTLLVTNIFALKSLPSGRAQVVKTTGYYSKGDGGDGTYRYDPLDTTAGDDFLTIQPFDGIGRYKLEVVGPVSVKQAGAGTVAGVDSSSDFQRALNGVSATGSPELYVPAGTYRLLTGLTCAGKPLTLRGAGIGKSKLVYEGTGVALSVTPSDIQQCVVIEDFDILPGNLIAASGQPLTITYPVTGSWASKTILVSRLNMNSNLTGPALPHWQAGPKFEQCWNGLFQDCFFTGKANDWLTTTSCIELGNNCTDFVIRNYHAFFTVNALSITGYSEGVSVVDSTFVKVYRGVNQSTASFLNLRFKNNHVNAVGTCFQMNNAAQNSISGNLLYLTDPLSLSFGNFEGCNSGQYFNNTCINLGNTTADGFAFASGALQNIVGANNFEGCASGVIFKATTSGNRAYANTRFNAGVPGTAVVDSGSNNTVTT